MWKRFIEAIKTLPRWAWVALSVLLTVFGLRALWRHIRYLPSRLMPGCPQSGQSVGPVVSPAEAEKKRTAIVRDYRERTEIIDAQADEEIRELDEWLENTDTDPDSEGTPQ